MVFGARPIGSRTLGDATGDAGAGGLPAQSIAATTVHVSYHLLSASIGVGSAPLHVELHLLTARVRGGLRHRGTTVRVVDRDGTFYGRLNANVSSVEYVLNGLDRAQFSFMADDPTAGLMLARVDTDLENDLLGVLHRELEVWHNGEILLQGPCPTLEIGDDGRCTGTIVGFPWWLFQRVIGRADRTNLLTNGGFETGALTGWSSTGAPTVVTTPVHTGNYAALLGAGDTLWQTVPFSHSHDPGIEPRFAVPVLMTSATVAPEGEVWFTVEASDKPGVITYHSYEVDSWPRDAYVEVTFGLGRTLSAHTAHTVTVRFYGAANGLYVDNVRLAQPESIGAPYGGADPAAVATLIVSYLQDTAHGKDDVGITGVTHPTGTITTSTFQDADHEEFGRVLAQLVGVAGGIDWWADYNAREMHFAAQRGTLKEQHKLRSGKTLASYKVRIDGTDTANSAIVIGVGADFTRDEGGYVETNDLPITEVVEHAPVSMPVRDYDLWAEELAGQHARPIETVVGAAGSWSLDLLGFIEPGDYVPVHVKVGAFESLRNHRVLSLVADFERDRLVPTLSATG